MADLSAKNGVLLEFICICSLDKSSWVTLEVITLEFGLRGIFLNFKYIIMLKERNIHLNWVKLVWELYNASATLQYCLPPVGYK